MKNNPFLKAEQKSRVARQNSTVEQTAEEPSLRPDPVEPETNPAHTSLPESELQVVVSEEEEKKPVQEPEIKEKAAAETVAPAEQPQSPDVKVRVDKSLGARYMEKFERKKMVETRSVNLPTRITPSCSKAMDDLIEQGKIKSKNDLINTLLEFYLFGGE